MSSSPTPLSSSPPIQHAPPDNHNILARLHDRKPASPAATTHTTPPPPTTAAPTKDERRPAPADLIGNKFPSFDHESAVVVPYNHELDMDALFSQQLTEKLFDVLMEAHAWAAFRPAHETAAAAQKFNGEIKTLMDFEKDQERTRARLNTFVLQIKSALAALTGRSLGTPGAYAA